MQGMAVAGRKLANRVHGGMTMRSGGEGSARKETGRGKSMPAGKDDGGREAERYRGGGGLPSPPSEFRLVHFLAPQESMDGTTLFKTPQRIGWVPDLQQQPVRPNGSVPLLRSASHSSNPKESSSRAMSCGPSKAPCPGFSLLCLPPLLAMVDHPL